MSDSTSAGFGKFIPGFDFLQNLAKGASDTVPQMPNLANWITPSLNVEELEKRISELKTVLFWLEQNSKALGATIQALEVQKMTLATLKGMNFNIGDVANAFTLKAADSMASGMQKATEKVNSPSKTISELAAEAEAAAQKVRDAAQPAPAAAAPAEPPETTPATPGLIDPMQLWGALTQQFQQIAASAMKDTGATAAMDATKSMATGLAKEAVEATKKAVATVVQSSTPVKAAVKSAAKTAVKAPAKKAAKKVANKTSGRAG
jgi:hypothetical protein